MAERSLRAFAMAVVLVMVCMFVLGTPIKSVAVNTINSNRSRIGEIVEKDEDEDEDWDFMDDDAVFGILKQQTTDKDTAKSGAEAITCVDVLPVERVDDNYCDCEDGSDEPNTSACSYVLLSSEQLPFGRQFQCKADDTFVSLIFMNDGVCDCCDGSDEAGGMCADTCETEWQTRLKTLKERVAVVQRGQRIRKSYLMEAVAKVKQLEENFERLAEAYQANERAFEDLQRQVQYNPGLKGQLEQSYNVLRRMKYMGYVQSRVVDPGTFSDAVWKLAFVELVGQCFSCAVNEKELKGGTPNVIPRTYEMVLCPFQNVSQTEPSYLQWKKEERQTKGRSTVTDENKEEEEIPRPIALGVWNRWHDAVSFSRVQSYYHGEPCANGHERHTRVELSCSTMNRVVSVEEREMCQYEIHFETPAACDGANENLLLEEIAQVKEILSQLQQKDKAKKKVDQLMEVHEEL